MVAISSSAVSCVQQDARSRHNRVRRGDVAPASTVISVPPDRRVVAAPANKKPALTIYKSNSGLKGGCKFSSIL